MKKLSALFLLVALISCGGEGGKTVVTINGKAITEGDLDLLGSFNPRIKMQLATPFGKKQILDNLVEQELLYQESLKRGVQNDSKVKAKIDLYKKVIISQALVDNELDKAAKEHYDQNKEKFEKLQLAHILVKFGDPKKAKKKGEKIISEAEALKIANSIKARLDKGEDFAKVAKETSEDNLTKGNGGDLGKASKNESRLERRGYGPLLEKAFTMKVGEIAGPIKTEQGYHIITLTKGVELEPFEEVKQSIMFEIQGDIRNKFLSKLKGDSKIVYAEEKKAEEKPATSAAPPAGEAGQAGQPATGAPAQPTTGQQTTGGPPPQPAPVQPPAKQ